MKRRKIRDLIEGGALEINDGYRAKNDELGRPGLPFARAANIDGELTLDSEAGDCLARDNVARAGSKLSQPADVVLTTKGSVGRVAYVRESDPQFVYSPQLSFWRVIDRSIVNPRYLYFWMQGKEARDQLVALKGQTDMADYVSLVHQRNMALTLPAMPEQEAVVAVLGALDDKIAVNRRLVRGLDRTTMTAYRSVVEGTESSLPVEEVAYIRGGSTPSTESPSLWSPGIHFWATPKDMTALRSPVLWKTERRISDAGLESISSRLLPTGTVLLSSRAPIGYVAIAAVPIAINQGFIALEPRAQLSSEFLCCWVRASMGAIEALGNGTTFMEVSKRSFRTLRVSLPLESLLPKFNALAKPTFEMMLSLERQNDLLSVLRALLLPRLIAGDIGRPKAESAIGLVV